MTNSENSKSSLPDQDCSWVGSEMYHLRQFKSLPIEEKFLAVEEMCEVYEFFSKRRKERDEA